MIYTTMTRNRVLRLIAKGWLVTGKLYIDFYLKHFDYYEIAFILDRDMPLLDGNGYDPGEEHDDERV